MSRRLINGRDWRMLTAAISGEFRHFSSSHSPWDNRDVSLNCSYETVSTSDSPSVAVNWCQDMDNGYHRSPWGSRDVSLDYFHQNESTSGSHSIAVDWYQWDDKYQRSSQDNRDTNHFSSSYSPWDNRDVSLNCSYETVSTSDSPSVAVNWCQDMDNGYHRSPWGSRDVSLDYFHQNESTSGSHSIAVDWYQWDDKYQRSPQDNRDVPKYLYEIETTSGQSVVFDMCRYIADDFDRYVADDFDRYIADDFDRSLREYSSSHYDDELLDDIVDEVFDSREPGSFQGRIAYLFKSGTLSKRVAYLFKTGMLSDVNNGISMIQGGVPREERNWEVCAFASTSAGASGGFYTLSSISSQALLHYMHFFGTIGSRATKIWTPAVSHAITSTDPYVGSRGTRDCLISVLEKNQISNYFKNAQTEIYFLDGGNYHKHYVPWFLQHKVRKVPSSAASEQFVRRLKNLQPKQRLLGSEDTVYQLQWYYNPENGLGFHGLWVGEIQQDGSRFFVRCVNNDISKEPYKVKLRKIVEEKVKNLPCDLLEEMENSWSSRPAKDGIIDYAVSEFLKHAVQGEEFLLDDYWWRATEFSRLLTNEKLQKIMETENFERGKYYNTEDLRMAVSDEIRAEARISYRPHAEYGVVPYGFTVLLDYQMCPIDHVDLVSNYDKFTFGG